MFPIFLMLCPLENLFYFFSSGRTKIILYYEIIVHCFKCDNGRKWLLCHRDLIFLGHIIRCLCTNEMMTQRVEGERIEV